MKKITLIAIMTVASVWGQFITPAEEKGLKNLQDRLAVQSTEAGRDVVRGQIKAYLKSLKLKYLKSDSCYLLREHKMGEVAGKLGPQGWVFECPKR